MQMIQVPSAYTESYAKGRLHDKALADNYIEHTWIGDPELDPIMEELASLPPDELHRFIQAGIEQQDEVLRNAPQSLRDFSRILKTLPGSTEKHSGPGFAPFT